MKKPICKCLKAILSMSHEKVYTLYDPFSEFRPSALKFQLERNDKSCHIITKQEAAVRLLLLTNRFNFQIIHLFFLTIPA